VELIDKRLREKNWVIHHEKCIRAFKSTSACNEMELKLRKICVFVILIVGYKLLTWW
jgi:hypothetical protein